MFRSLLRKPFRLSVAEATLNNFLRLRHHESCTKIQFPTSTSSSHSDSTISFFRTSCGLSPSVALTAAARTNLKTTANAKLVLGLLKIYGFTKSQITIIATKLPALFSYHPEKCIKAKIELFLSAGFTGTAIAKLISKDPSIIKSSLERKLRPNLHLLMTVHSGDRESAATSIAGSTWLLSLNPEKQILPNMKTLQKHGVPDANIARLFKWCPRVITQEPSRFSKSVALLEEMGFKQSTSSFVIGIKVVSGLDVATWERKLQLYHSLGWSQEEVISAFKKNPFCMLLSEDKIRKVMGFFVEKLKWEPCRLASLPIALSYSLEKRIVPRYAVFNFLTTRGLPGTNLSFLTLLLMSESDFLKKCLCKYSYKIPKLMEVYKVKMDMTCLKTDL